MSRIGLKPVDIPAGVEVSTDANIIKIKGPKGEANCKIADNLKVELNEKSLSVIRPSDSRKDKEQHGLARALIHNMVVGVTEGYEKKMTVNGVGYSATKQGNKLVLKLGLSHPVEMVDPDGITTECPDANTIIVKGIDKELVGNYAANIRKWRKPEPYKGKGIIYDGEVIHKKEGKSGATA